MLPETIFLFNIHFMQASIEITLYPLKEEYIPEIIDFIERVKKYSRIKVVESNTSTMLFGDYKELMSIITDEIELTFQRKHKSVFVLKILNVEYVQ